MPRRRTAAKSANVIPKNEEADIDHDSGDDELARELEEERQRILAAAEPGPSSSPGSSQAIPEQVIDDAQTEDDEDGTIYGEGDSEMDDPDEEEEEEDSQDEWQPPAPASKANAGRSKRGRRQSSSEDSDADIGADLPGEDPEPATKKSKKTPNGRINGKKAKGKTPAPDPPLPDESIDQEDADDSFDEEAERVQAEVEAAAAWADVRRRKEAASQPQPQPTNGSPSNTSSTKQSSTAPSLTAWLGKGPSAASSVSELSSTLPMPTTCKSAQIVDRNSLFIGYVYPLITTSPAYISTLLSHLTRVVHPTVPVDLLPPQFANAPANKRGSSHDMYAYRVLELKRGRSGLGGPDDFSLQEDKEDDGERWGGDRVLKVVREEGASDVLVVVSRWYGGELLGPVRFEHIENAARNVLEEHMRVEEVEEFRQRIQHLDRRIAKVKAKLAGEGEGVGDQVNKYEGLTLEKGQRLWLARRKALEVVEKRLAGQASQPTASQSQEQGQEMETEAVEEQHAAPSVDIAGAAAEEPISTETIASAEPEPPAAVKQEPSTTNLSITDAASLPSVKAEPSDTNIPPVHIKSETNLSPPALLQDEPDDKSRAVKSEPDDQTDLTGWDDLA
ncbi:UPF0029 domain-containing protein [Pseudozyma hubeiensis]|nr:UPF0029 domain-containing protein [Pseudozyma hubeiensis]